MTSDKKNISLLADIFVKHGLENIVISPGSRNAPITISFANRPEINTFTIVDERSAAFFALGLSLQSGKTTAIACSSGSAVLNYASAISEAFYQKIPLLVLTADRPPHLIDVGDGQTIRQNEVFKNIIKKSFTLYEDDFENNENIINEALNTCLLPQPGPVHINIPFDEPLYNITDEKTIGTAEINKYEDEISTNKIPKIASLVNCHQKVMIIAGQNTKDEKLQKALSQLANNKNVTILCETTSNIYNEKFVDTIDNVVSGLKPDEKDKFKPEVLLTFGGQVVSKMIKNYLRKYKAKYHFHISPSGENMDTYFSLSETIKAQAVDFFTELSRKIQNTQSNYSHLWLNKKQISAQQRHIYLKQIEFSDLKVFNFLLNEIPSNSILHLGNSTPVRYSQLFGSRKDLIYNSNRGVSGIDGQVSTALGYSQFSEKTNFLITGDLGFFYDSNGLMNHYLKPNLKIILINNGGGGIFRFIPGPDTTPNLESVFEAKHNWKAEHICKAFNVSYHKAENIEELELGFSKFLNSKSTTANLLEIFTPAEKNAEILREYFKFIKD